MDKEENVHDRVKRFYERFEDPLASFGTRWLYLKVRGGTVHVGEYKYLNRGFGVAAVRVCLNTGGGAMPNLAQSSDVWEKIKVYDDPEYARHLFTAEFKHDQDMIAWLLEQEFEPDANRIDSEWAVVDK